MEGDTSIPGLDPVLVLAPEQMAGPYFRNPRLIRRNISEGASGTPLLLKLTLVDVDSGAPLPDVLVDIWHCNARGAYSGWSKINPDLEVDVGDIGSVPRTDDDTYLRGGQFSNSQGVVRFTTIYPGFYAGRSVHIHVAVRIVAGGNYLEARHVAWVGQLYFPEVTTRSVFAAKDYSGRSIAPLRNDQDELYREMHGEASQLDIRPIGRDSWEDGFFAQLTIGIDKRAMSAQIKPGDFDIYTV